MNFPMISQKVKWHFADQTPRDKWFLSPSVNPESLIKQNSRRSIFRISTDSGILYVKIDSPKKRFDRIKMRCFPSPEQKEFDTFLNLKKKNIPVCPYIAIGNDGLSSILVSREMTGFVNAMEFWFRIALHNPSLRKVFLENAARLCGSLNRSGIVHPDLHSGNLMVNTATGEVALIDLAGISFRKKALSGRKQTFSMELFCDFAGELNSDEIDFVFRTAGFSPAEIPLIWNALKNSKYQLFLRTWEKRKAQLLSGHSKYCRTDSNGVIWRNSLWFAPVKYDENELIKHQYSSEEAETLWINAFRDELQKIRHPAEQSPVGFFRSGPDTVVLFCKANEKAGKN